MPTFKQFLEAGPIAERIEVTEIRRVNFDVKIPTPIIQLHCSSDLCGERRYFDGRALHASSWSLNAWQVVTLAYTCRNCGQFEKIFSIHAFVHTTSTSGTLAKIGELPPAGDPLSTKLITLVGADKDYLLKAYRSELAGHGIGAFAYYRRIIESQRARLFEQIVKAAKKLPHAESFVKDIEQAARETQFTKSIEKIKAAIPDSLLIGGHNPLKVLHDVLSDGIHQLSDAECLSRSEIVRTILGGLAHRLSEISKEESALNAALSRAFNKDKN